jgi:uncharacterized protein YegJ (DUF2314 family)
MSLQVWLIVAIAVVALVIAWRRTNRRKKRPAVCREGQSPVVLAHDDDEAVNAAMALARRNLPKFIARLTDPAYAHCDFSVKVRMSQGDIVEHIWMTDVRYDGALFHGMISNEPLDLEGIEMGAQASATADEISDWVIWEGEELRGGFTVRVLTGQGDLTAAASDPLAKWQMES